MSAAIERLKLLYTDFLAADPAAIASVYAHDVVFRDPVHEVRGLEAMQQYFAGVSQNLQECRFQFDFDAHQQGRGTLWWMMEYRHPRLGGGKLLKLRGASLLEIDQASDRVVRHEDVYDLGAMVYEQVPLLGSVVRSVKRRLADNGSAS
uniref:nuclear transport factor 2 family protein n=1 Tax=Microbulbifer agarilyticus TaxID=260552 RepID=UPI000255BB93|nr:nuclear transport factor 2 family protein [Microbulbifer agarilyticus]